MVAIAMMGISVVLYVVMLLLGAALLWLTTKMFQLKKNDFKTAFIVNLFVFLVYFVFSMLISWSGLWWLFFLELILLFVLASFLVKYYYRIASGKTLLIVLVWGALSFIVNVVVAFVVSIIAIGIVGMALL